MRRPWSTRGCCSMAGEGGVTARLLFSVEDAWPAMSRSGNNGNKGSSSPYGSNTCPCFPYCVVLCKETKSISRRITSAKCRKK
jgi:hypothetical protein